MILWRQKESATLLIPVQHAACINHILIASEQCSIWIFKDAIIVQGLCYKWSHAAHTHTTILRLYEFCPGQPGWASTIRSIHPLMPIMVINHPLCASSI